MKRRKVIIDVDTGCDDAQALILALRSPLLEVIGITTVAGNVDVDQVTANTLKVLDIVDAPSDIPVSKGCPEALVQGPHFCPEIHGPDGLGGLNTSPSSRLVSPMHAVTFLITTLLSSIELITLIMIAPLTNLAIALRMEPKIKEKIESIIFMGGSATSGGNVTQWAEANMFCDPEAAHIVLTSGLNIIMYGWDVYQKVTFSKDEVSQFLTSPNPWAQFSGKLMTYDINHFNLECAVIGDAGAVAVAIQPEGLITKPMHLVMELQGTHTRGMTVVDFRPEVFQPDKTRELPNVHIAVELDIQMYKKLFRDTLLA